MDPRLRGDDKWWGTPEPDWVCRRDVWQKDGPPTQGGGRSQPNTRPNEAPACAGAHLSNQLMTMLTARRLRAQALSFEAVSTGRSLPWLTVRMRSGETPRLTR